MADLTITETSVVAQDDAKIGAGVAGETITQGQPIYRATDGKMYKAANTTAILADAKGIALSAGAIDEQVFWVSEGGIALGATLGITTAYYVSGSGAIQPGADLGSAEFATYLGSGKTAAILDVQIHAVGVAVP